MQARLHQEVLVDGGGDGADIADVLHHSGDGQGDDGDAGGDEHPGVNAVGEKTEDGGVLVYGDANPVGGSHSLGNSGAGGGINDHGDQVGDYNADEDGDDLDHALAPHIANDNHNDGDDGHQPVGAAVVDGGRGKDQADGDDDGTGDDGREEAHDLVDAHGLDDAGQNDIHQARNRHGKAGVRQQVSLAVGGDCPVTGKISKR